MKSICASLEERILVDLRQLEIDVPVCGLLETAGRGEVKQEDLSAVQLRVFGMQQLHETMEHFSVTAEIRLTVEQAESANGAIFYDSHEAVALWLQRIMIGNACTALHTDDVFVDGLQVGSGGDADFDTSNGVWYAVWNVTLTGRLKN